MVAVTTAKLQEAQDSIGRYDAAVKRWESEGKRLTDLVAQKVVDAQVLDESRKQLQSNQSSRAVAQSTVMARQAEQGKATVDVEAAHARAKVSDAAEKRLAALVSYTKITAPYKGIVVARNADTGDFVQSATGDQSAAALARTSRARAPSMWWREPTKSASTWMCPRWMPLMSIRARRHASACRRWSTRKSPLR